MANCHKNFLTGSDSFHSKINLDESKVSSLRVSRDNLRKHIRAKFEELNRPKIKFKMQGSFDMNTTVNPLNGDYDIDDGVYFSPSLEERPTSVTVHNWIVDAAKSYKTVDPPIDKKRCVRVPFKSGYHVDFPIYDLVENNNGQEDSEPHLAVKLDGWIFSDPVKITNWFSKNVKDTQGQLRRIVRYFKAWADYENQSTRPKMPSGLVLTILATEEFCFENGEDSAFGNTASAIYDRLTDDENIFNPVDSTENLRNRITDVQFFNFLERLDYLIRSAETAIEHSSKEEAAKHWKKRLGDRFPVYKDPENKATKFAAVAPAIRKNTSSA